MKTMLLVIGLMVFQFSGFAQLGKFLPIIDDSLICSSSFQLFFIVEGMPEPEISNDDIELLLEENISFNSRELNSQGIIYLQCIVNCEGRAGDYQIQECPADLVNVGCRTLNFFSKNINNWYPPIQRGKGVDLLARIRIGIKNGKFIVDAPYY